LTTVTEQPTANPTLSALKRFADLVRTERLRSIREFAEQELVIPTGPFAGRRFTCNRNPFLGLWFEAVNAAEQNGWRRFVATGPQQSGKTFGCFVIPTMYHLFEMKETVLCGLPSLDLVTDKWTQDLLPAIEASRYRELLPRSGAGSRRGRIGDRVLFGNGTTLRFMTGGGGDKARAGFTSRVLVISETDGMDAAGGASREADKISQLEGRTRAFGDRARVYMECTVSTQDGRTHQEYTNGTASRIAIRCAHCRAYVTPEREHLIGWQDAKTVVEAGAKGRLTCPDCGAAWEEPERIKANLDCRLVHKGQTITVDGSIDGDAPPSDTLGFRWSAANNLLVKASVVAQEEWRATKDPDEDNADKKMRQFFWALPHKSKTTDLTTIDAHQIMARVSEDAAGKVPMPPRGRVPTGAQRITVAIDLGKWCCHWTAIAWRPHASPHVVEYGRIDVATADFGEEHALLAALRSFRDDVCVIGWAADGGPMKPTLSFVDAGYLQGVVLRFCAESPGFVAAKGRGTGQLGGGRRDKRETGSKVVGVGDGYEIVQLPGYTVPLVEIDTDKWKSWLHARIKTPLGQPGAFTLFQSAVSNEHLSYAKHLTAEKKQEEHVAGKGLVTRWVALHRNNHWLDATMMSAVAGNAIGERLIDEPQPIVTMAPARKDADGEPRTGWLPDRPSNWMNR
jgi:hypothetical protein